MSLAGQNYTFFFLRQNILLKKQFFVQYNVCILRDNHFIPAIGGLLTHWFRVLSSTSLMSTVMSESRR